MSLEPRDRLVEPREARDTAQSRVDRTQPTVTINGAEDWERLTLAERRSLIRATDDRHGRSGPRPVSHRRRAFQLDAKGSTIEDYSFFLRAFLAPYLLRAVRSQAARLEPCFLWQAFRAALSFCWVSESLVEHPSTEIGVF